MDCMKDNMMSYNVISYLKAETCGVDIEQLETGEIKEKNNTILPKHDVLGLNKPIFSQDFA